jgi:flavin-dependent dehydrogenase
MSFAQYDVIVVGAGCAGLTAAIGLARAGFVTAVVEAAAMPGGSGDLGGVCFAESLAQPDVLGPDGVEALTWERRLIERGSFATDGRRLVGSTYRDADAFRACYTVLRPLFDNHLAQITRMHGVALLAETVVEALIRDGRRIIGVSTSRGALYADLIFLAEGDAGQLVSREGFDRFGTARESPTFLYGLQQVFDLPPGAIEESFRVGPEQGVAYDLLLRNPSGARLNARGLVCTNRQSLTLSVLLPAANWKAHVGGQPRQLLEWFADMPALRPWWREGKPGAWTAHLIRAGSLRNVPYLVEDGLVVGGAAAGLGVDFPVPNSTAPATATGLLLCRAAAAIRGEGGGFHREQLIRHYVEPLRQTRYWRDMEFLQRWPSYVRRTRVLFDQELDLLLDSAAVWARPRRWLPVKLLGWLLILGRVRWAEWSRLRLDLIAAGRALRMRQVLPRPALARVLLDGALNAFRDLARRPRPDLPPGGSLSIHYSAEDVTTGKAPILLRRWFERFRPVLGSAARILCRNDDTPLSAKMTAMVELLLRQVNLLDLLAAAGLGFVTGLASTVLDACAAVFRRLFRRRTVTREATHDRGSARSEESERATGAAAAIHIVWRSTQPEQRADAVRNLSHVCPTGVFEVQGSPPGPMQVEVHGERCIACEACWRMIPCVDWARSGPPPHPAPILSPVTTRLLAAEDRAGLVPPAAPRQLDPWPADMLPLAEGEPPRRLDQLEHKLDEFDRALARGSASVDRPRGEHLEMLARYAHQLAHLLHETLLASDGSNGPATRRRALDLAASLVTATEARMRRTWDGLFAWAAADGRLLRRHHMTGLRRLLGTSFSHDAQRSTAIPTLRSASRINGERSSAPDAEDACAKHMRAEIAAQQFLLTALTDAADEENPAQGELLAALADEIRTSLPTNAAEEVYRRFGRLIVEDLDTIRSLLDVPGDWPALAQRRALLAEREELQAAEDRLSALASDGQQALREPDADAALSGEWGRQAALVLAGKRLLLHTHTLLENGLDAELAIVLLRVWLDRSATLLDEFTIAVRDRLLPPTIGGGRPLVEPGGGTPPATLADYRNATDTYAPGDFLLTPVDLLQPRLVPEMVGGEEERITSRPVSTLVEASEKPAASPAAGDEILLDLLRQRDDLRARPPRLYRPQEALFLAEALALEMLGRCMHRPAASWPLEMACSRLILSDLRQPGSALPERCAILRALADDVLPRCRHGDRITNVRHLAPEALELEALKADCLRRLMAAGTVFGAALGQNPDVQASCFALAEATAWIKAADSTLGRLAWLVRRAESDESEEPAARLDVGRRVLAHCHAEVRDRLFRFDQDLAALRRGYYAPHVRAAELLSRPEPELPPAPPVSDIRRPLRVLVVVEPGPAETIAAPDGGGRVLESLWTLSDTDRAALENALRLRDAAPELVTVEVAAVGPPRVGPALCEVLSLGIERVRLAVPRQGELVPDRAAASLTEKLHRAPFDLILGGFHAGDRLAVLLAEALRVPVAGHAATVSVRTERASACLRLASATAGASRERPLPAAVLIDAGTPLRLFTIAGYLAGLRYELQITPV